MSPIDHDCTPQERNVLLDRITGLEAENKLLADTFKWNHHQREVAWKRAEKAEQMVLELEEKYERAGVLLTDRIAELEAEVVWRDRELKRLGDINKQNAAVMPLAQKRITELEAENKLLRERLDDCLRGHYGLNPAMKGEGT